MNEMSASGEVPPDTSPAEARRHVTVLFTDLSDSTHLSGAMEAETYALLLDDVRQAFCTAVGSRGGTINQFQGDGLQALFGHPAASEHDGQRAVDAALAVHRSVRALGDRYPTGNGAALSVHTGVHAGLTLARQGDSVAGLIELFGPVPGIAKHLSDVAEADEILVSDETLGPALRLFDSEPPRPVKLKGRAEPLAVRRILSRRRLPARPGLPAARGSTGFIGREAELAQLELLLAGVLEGGSACIALRASAGFGKTRLADEFLHRAAQRGCGVMHGLCDGDWSAEPLLPFVQMLRAHFELPPSAPAPVVAQVAAAWLAAQPAGAVGAAAQPAPRLETALLGIVRARARQAPLLLFVDDWQWADAAARNLLEDLQAERLPGLMLLLAGRPEAASVGAFQPPALELNALPEAQARQAVLALLPAVDPFTLEAIVQRAGGVPLYIEELCHGARAAGWSRALEPGDAGPAWLESLIASRATRLPAALRRIVEAAAVIGNRVPAAWLESLCGCGIDHPDVAALAAEDLLFAADEPGLLRFKHGLTRDAIYRTIGLQARRAAHRRMAELLAEDGTAEAEARACEALAYHFSGAGDDERAARCATQAGDKAVAASAIDRARAQYTAALSALDRLPHLPTRYQAHLAVLRRLGLVCAFDPARSDLALFEQAVARARRQDDATGVAYASYWLAYLHYALGDNRQALDCGSAAASAARHADEQRLLVQVQALLGQAQAAAGQPAALDTLDAALAVLMKWRTASEKPPAGLAYTLACRASVLGDQGRLEEALAGFEQALAEMPAAGHEVEGSVLCLRSNVNLWHGRWQAAAADAEAARAVAERVRSLYLLAMSRSLAASAEWLGQRTSAALERLAEGHAWLVDHDKRLFISLNHGRLAEALLDIGRVAEARSHAAAALSRWRQQDPLGAAMALRAMARLAVAQGRPALAVRRLRQAERVAAARQSRHEHAANARCRETLFGP